MRTQLKSGKVIIFYFLEAFFIFKSEKIEKLEKSQNLLKLLKSTLGPNDYNSWLTSENNCYIEVNDAVLRCSMKIYDVAFRWVFLSM